MESYVRLGRRGFKSLTYAYMEVEGVKNCQNRFYVINEWPLRKHKENDPAQNVLLKTKDLQENI